MMCDRLGCGMVRPRRGGRTGGRRGGRAPVHLDEIGTEPVNEETLPPPPIGGEIASMGKARRQGGSNLTFVQDLACCNPEFCISGVEYRYPISGIGTQIQHWNLGIGTY
ncbi:hypothetical protein GQ457_09G021900 [Hibiscus cannabinus]